MKEIRSTLLELSKRAAIALKKDKELKKEVKELRVELKKLIREGASDDVSDDVIVPLWSVRNSVRTTHLAALMTSFDGLFLRKLFRYGGDIKANRINAMLRNILSVMDDEENGLKLLTHPAKGKIVKDFLDNYK